MVMYIDYDRLLPENTENRQLPIRGLSEIAFVMLVYVVNV